MTDKVTTAAAYSASGSTFAIGALTANELAAYAGVVCVCGSDDSRRYLVQISAPEINQRQALGRQA